MPENREELLRHYRESRERLLATIEGLSDDEMSEPSIDGWSVKDHLAHLALWDGATCRRSCCRTRPDLRTGSIAKTLGILGWLPKATTMPEELVAYLRRIFQ